MKLIIIKSLVLTCLIAGFVFSYTGLVSCGETTVPANTRSVKISISSPPTGTCSIAATFAQVSSVEFLLNGQPITLSSNAYQEGPNVIVFISNAPTQTFEVKVIGKNACSIGCPTCFIGQTPLFTASGTVPSGMGASIPIVWLFSMCTPC